MKKTINDLVCTPAQALKLKKLGIKQRSVFYFNYLPNMSSDTAKLFINIEFSNSVHNYRTPCLDYIPKKPTVAAAFTLQEILPLMDKIDADKLELPKELKQKYDDIDFLFWSTEIKPELFVDTIIIAIEQKAISVNEINQFL